MRNVIAFVLGAALAGWLASDPLQPPASYTLDPFVRVQDVDGDFVGSGSIVYSREGETFVLTAGHVAGSLDRGIALVEIYRYRDGKLIGTRNIVGHVVANTWDKTPFNEPTDLALIKLEDGDEFPTVRIHDGPIPRHVWALSAPAGADPIASHGEIQSLDYGGMMRSTAWVFPGSSGGAMCVRSGRGWEVCGLVAMTWKNGGYLVGYVCLAVRQEEVRAFLAERGLLGGGE